MFQKQGLKGELGGDNLAIE